MFRIVCDPSSGSVERAWLKLLVIFFVCVVGVWHITVQNYATKFVRHRTNLTFLFKLQVKITLPNLYDIVQIWHSSSYYGWKLRCQICTTS